MDPKSLGSIYTTAKIIFTLLDFLLLVLFFYSFSKLLEYRPKFVSNPKKHKKKRTLRTTIIEERWNNLMKKFNTGEIDAMKFAIVDADSLIDDVLKQMSLPGEHFADRLGRLAADELKSFDRLWTAHRVRNDLVHTAGFTLDPNEATRTIKDYEAFLREIGALTP